MGFWENHYSDKKGFYPYDNFALEYASYVFVNSNAPGWINTDMNKQLPVETIQERTAKIYLKRFAEVAEIASFVSFMVSDKCSYLNRERRRILKLKDGINFTIL